MTCSECVDALVLLADREAGLSLSDGERREALAAEAHVTWCGSCRAELDLVRDATVLFTALPSAEPSASFDARVLAAFFAEQAMAQPAERVERVGMQRLPRWVRRVAVGYAAGWGTVAAATAVWMVAGGWHTAIQLCASVTGPAISSIASATQHGVEFLASLVVALRLADRVVEVVAPAMFAIGRALQPSPLMTLMLVSLAGVAGLLALLTQLPRVTRRRTRHVHAILWTA